MRDKESYNELYEKHGYWERYYFDKDMLDKGYYINGKKIGYWEFYDYNGNLTTMFYATD